MKYLLTAGFSLFLLFSCSTTKITSRWKPKTAPQSSFNKIISLVVVNDEDRPLREKMEKHIAGDFTALGYKSFSAFTVFGPKELKGLSESALMQKMAEEAVDAVMMVSLLNKKKEKYYVPGRAQLTPYGSYYNNLWRHYQAMNERTLTEGYYAEDTRYFWECNFYDTRTGRLLYSSISESFDPNSTEGLAHQYGALMVSDMVKEKIIVDKISKASFQQ